MKSTTGVPAELMSNLLKSILVFMEKTGMTRSEIEQAFHQCSSAMNLKSAKNARKADLQIGIGCDTVAGAVLRAWHRESQFVDDNANPIPLHLKRGRVTLSSLIRMQDESTDVEKLVDEMHSTDLIRKDTRGRYLPTTSAATIRQMHPLAIDHVAKTVMRLVETVDRNMRSSVSKPPLIERYAHVPDLGANEARAFAAFTRQQGAACLEAIEDWLEARRNRRRSSSRPEAVANLSAGMHIFAYLGDSRKAVRKGDFKKRTPTPSRAARA